MFDESSPLLEGVKYDPTKQELVQKQVLSLDKYVIYNECIDNLIWMLPLARGCLKMNVKKWMMQISSLDE